MKMKTITVAKLIDRLMAEDPHAQVIFSCNYGDYHNTQQALPIKGETEEVHIERSAYSHSGFAIAGDDAPDLDNDQTFLVLR